MTAAHSERPAADVEVDSPPRVVIHPQRCMASERCRTIAPGVFASSPEGWVALRRTLTPEDDLELVLDAAVACPTTSIEVFASDGTRLWPA